MKVKQTALPDIADHLGVFKRELCYIHNDNRGHPQNRILEESFAVKHAQNVKVMLCKLDSVSEEEPDVVATCKDRIYDILCRINRGHYRDNSEPYFMAAVQSGLVMQAAVDIRWAFRKYMTSKVSFGV